jgi:hypothetical protein
MRLQMSSGSLSTREHNILTHQTFIIIYLSADRNYVWKGEREILLGVCDAFISCKGMNNLCMRMPFGNNINLFRMWRIGGWV